MTDGSIVVTCELVMIGVTLNEQELLSNGLHIEHTFDMLFPWTYWTGASR